MSGETVCLTADLPEPGTRWVASRKEAVLDSLARGTVSEAEVLQRYPDMTIEELRGWEKVYHRHGRKGLNATRRQP